MARATFNGQVIAESERFEVVEGNVYFPPASLNRAFVRGNDAHTVCAWKGTASYLDVVVGDREALGAVWFYPDPKPAAAKIKDHFAFWRGVTVER